MMAGGMGNDTLIIQWEVGQHLRLLGGVGGLGMRRHRADCLQVPWAFLHVHGRLSSTSGMR